MLIKLFASIGYILGFLFTALCLASGLYYAAELIEEYTVLAKKLIAYIILAVAWLHLVLMYELPVVKVGFSMACLGVYSLMLRQFPMVVLVSPAFILSCVLVISNHILWFTHFSHNPFPLPFVASWFGICIWMVPFLFFVSTCANDSTLPAYEEGKNKSWFKDATERVGNVMKAWIGAVTPRGSSKKF